MNITLAGRSVTIRLSAAARKSQAERATPLLAEMELLFSCLIRKRVRFATWKPGRRSGLPIRWPCGPGRSCTAPLRGGGPGGCHAAGGFPIANSHPYVMRWLAIDLRQGQWLGELGSELPIEGRVMDWVLYLSAGVVVHIYPHAVTW